MEETLWERFVDQPMEQARTIQKHAGPSNIETAVTYEALMAGALAAQRVLIKHAKNFRCSNKIIIGVPSVFLQ